MEQPAEGGRPEGRRAGADRPAGLDCPACGRHEFEVLQTRRGRGAVLRRRECLACGRRITTSERRIGP